MTLVELFKQGYDIGSSIPREARARATARKQYGDLAADNPDLFIALQQDARAGKQLELQQAQDTRAQGTYDFNMQGAQQDKRKEAVLGLVNGLRAARDSGEDVGKAFDRFASSGLLDQLGVNPGDRDQMRQAVVDNPALLDQYYSSLTDPATAAKLQLAGAKTAEAAADKVAGAQKTVRVLDDVLQRIDILEDPKRESAGRSIFGLPGPRGVLGSGGFGSLGTIPGSAASDYASNLTGLESDIRSAAFETLKGGGQITEKESQFAADAIARLSRSTSYDEYRRELTRLRSYLNDLRGAAEARLGGRQVSDVTPTDDTTPAPAEQQTYGDGSGPKLYIGFTDPDLGTYIGGDPTKAESWRK